MNNPTTQITKINKEMDNVKDKLKQVALYLEADKMGLAEAYEYKVAALKSLEKVVQQSIKDAQFNADAFNLPF